MFENVLSDNVTGSFLGHPERKWRSALSSQESISDVVRAVLKEYGRLSVDVDSVSDDADLYQAGMTSHASVNLMLALEDAFDVEFPDEMLRRSVFESISAISAAVGTLKIQDPV